MVNVQVPRDFFQVILELFLWCLSVAMANGELTTQYDPGQVMISNLRDVSSPV